MDFLASSWLVAMVHLVETTAMWGAAIFIIYTLVRVSWKSDAAQRFWLALPLVGSTLSTAYAYRWITALKLGIWRRDSDARCGCRRVARLRLCRRRGGLRREGQLALREGRELSTLWAEVESAASRDWVDFIETGEVSGALETAFTNLEDEAARSWDLAQKRMTDWMPKIIYFFILLVIGARRSSC